MTFFIILILLVFIFILLLFTAALKVIVVFDTYRSDLNLTLLWLHSYIKAFISLENSKPMVSLFLLNKKLFKKEIKTGKRELGGLGYIKCVDSRDVHINALYGFRDPYVTGITCGAVNAALQFINIDSINHSPDFVAENDYIYMDARAKVNLGSTLTSILKLRTLK